MKCCRCFQGCQACRTASTNTGADPKMLPPIWSDSNCATIVRSPARCGLNLDPGSYIDHGRDGKGERAAMGGQGGQDGQDEGRASGSARGYTPERRAKLEVAPHTARGAVHWKVDTAVGRSDKMRTNAVSRRVRFRCMVHKVLSGRARTTETKAATAHDGIGLMMGARGEGGRGGSGVDESCRGRGTRSP